MAVKSDAAFAADMLEIRKKIKDEENKADSSAKEYRALRREL